MSRHLTHIMSHDSVSDDGTRFLACEKHATCTEEPIPVPRHRAHQPEQLCRKHNLPMTTHVIRGYMCKKHATCEDRPIPVEDFVKYDPQYCRPHDLPMTTLATVSVHR